jgi:hypothetical protein
MRYVLNCGWLMMPIFVWNLVLVTQLPPAFQPDVFWRDIPPALAWIENTLRLAVSVVPFLMPLPSQPLPKVGVALYMFGLVAYAASWLLLIWWPGSWWSHSMAGFTAPAYTPLFWLLGITLLGRQLFIPIGYRPWTYGTLSVLFVSAHLAHAVLIVARVGTTP